MTSAATVDPLQFWREALAGKKPAIVDGQPHRGYYSMREGGKRLPVQVYPVDGGAGLVAYVGAKGQGRAADAAVVWLRIAGSPAAHEAWRPAYNGQPWPDEAPTPVSAESRPALPPDEAKRLEADARALTEDWRAKDEPPPGGHNRPHDGVLSDLGDELDNLGEKAATVLRRGVVTQGDADLCANVKDEARALKKRIDEAYRVEWEPLNEAIKAVRAKFAPAQGRAEDIVSRLSAAVTRWMTAEEKKRQEATVAALAKGAEPAPEDAAPVRVGGAAGARTGLRKAKDTAVVNDWAALFAALVDNPEMRALAQIIANRAAAVGGVFPGTTIVKGGKKAT